MRTRYSAASATSLEQNSVDSMGKNGTSQSRSVTRPTAHTSEVRLSISAIRFLMVGGANTAVGLALIYAAKWLGADDVPANAIGYAVGLTLSFSLNRRWTFRYVGRTASALARFIAVVSVAYVLNLVTVVKAIDLLHINTYIAQALGIVPYTVFTYLASRHFAFRQPARRTHTAEDETC
jgi:putative flippase GtrA